MFYLFVSILAISSSSSVWITEPDYSRYFDGSSSEMSGYIKVPLDDVYLKKTTNTGDYSFYFWMMKSQDVDYAFLLSLTTTGDYCCNDYYPAVFLDRLNSQITLKYVTISDLSVSITDNTSWKLVAFSVSQASDTITLCVFESGTGNCSSSTKEDTFYIENTHYLYVGRDTLGAYDGFIGLIGSVRFYNNEARTDFGSVYTTAVAISECNGTWGPTIHTCNDWGKLMSEPFKTSDMALDIDATHSISLGDPIFNKSGSTYELTVLAWFKTDSITPSSDQIIFGVKNNLNVFLFQLILKTNGELRACLNSGGTCTNDLISHTTTLGNWEHCGVSIKNDNGQITMMCKDQVLQSSIPNTDNNNYAFSDLIVMVGGETDSNVAAGQYYDLRVYYHYFSSAPDYNNVSGQPLVLYGADCSSNDFINCSSCNANSILHSGYCEPCNDACATCSDFSESSCSGCNTGFYQQPGHSELCLEFCPIGFSASGTTCTGTNERVISIDFENNLTVKRSVGTGATLYYGIIDNDYYPEIEFLDPFPSIERGIYFNYTKFASLFKSSGDEFALGVDFSVEMWVRSTDYGGIFSISKHSQNINRNSDYLAIGISYDESSSTDSFYVEFLGHDETSAVTDTQYSFAHNYSNPEWRHIALSVSYNSAAKQSTITYYINQQSFSFVAPSYFRDTEQSIVQFGTMGSLPKFSGFLYSVYFYNYVRTSAEVTATVNTACTGTCSVCPSNGTCLSLCEWNEFPDNGSCTACNSSCESGCMRTSDCSFCFDTLCEDCSTYYEGSCTRCNGVAILENGGCSCPDPNYINSEGICSSCNAPCQTCASGLDSFCLACEDGYYLVDGECVNPCENQYYVDGNTCKKCPSGCTQCTIDGCSACETSYFLNNLVCLPCGNGCNNCASNGCQQCATGLDLRDGQCVCNDGFYYDGTQCSACDSSCKTCITSATVCETCHDGSSFMISTGSCNTCVDFEGYGGSISVNIIDDELKQSLIDGCIEICGDGLNMGDLPCDDGNTVNGDGCSSSCTIEAGWACSGGSFTTSDTCADVNPYPLLTYVSKTNSGYETILSFSESVSISGSLSIDISVGSASNFEYELLPTTNSGLYNPYNLNLTLFESVEASTRLIVTVNNPSSITDSSGHAMTQPSATLELTDSFEYSSSEAISTAMTGVTATASGSTSVGLSTSLLGGGDLSAVWGMVEAMQIMNYLVMMQLKYPDNAKVFLSTLEIANLSFMPNIGEIMTDGDEEFEGPPAVFKEQGYKTSFFINSGSILTITLITLFTFPAVVMLAKIFPKCKIFQTWRSKFFYSVFLRVSIESFLELALSVCLQMNDLGASSFFGVLSVVLCFFVLLYIAGCIGIVLLKITRLNSGLLNTENYLTKFGTLYDTFKTDSMISKSFLVIQHSRRLLLVLMLVLLIDYKEVQAIMIMTTFTCYLAAIVVVRPYKNFVLGTLTQILGEGFILVGIGISMKFLDEDLDAKEREDYGYAFISVMGISLLIYLVSSLVTQFLELWKLIKKIIRKFRTRYLVKPMIPKRYPQDTVSEKFGTEFSRDPLPVEETRVITEAPVTRQIKTVREDRSIY